MRRMHLAVALAAGFAAAAAVVPLGSPRAGADRPVTVSFGFTAHESGLGFSELRGKGALMGQGDQSGVERLKPVPDAEGRPPVLTFSASRLGRERTYRLFVNSGQYNRTARSTALVLSVEVFDSNDPDCRERTATRPGARGRVILAEREEGSSVVLELACGVDTTWNDDPRVGIDIVVGKPKPAPGTFTLAASKVTNVNQRELKIDAAGGKATLDHCCDGGAWKTDYTWKVPKTITAGKASSITLGIKLYDVKPSQPNSDQISAVAPDFRQDLPIRYPDTPSATKTYSMPLAASQAGQKEIFVYVGFPNGEVRYTYRRTGS